MVPSTRLNGEAFKRGKLHVHVGIKMDAEETNKLLNPSLQKGVYKKVSCPSALEKERKMPVEIWKKRLPCYL